MSKSDLHYMMRCFELAKRAGKNVKSNPNVGAVLVYNDTIIGEGYHQKYGEHHAEINALNSVKPRDRHLIKDSRIYVSLEPCCIHRKTPPCSDAIINSGIQKVIISATDPNPDVNGKSITLLRERGIEVITDVARQEGEDLLLPFITQFHRRPYIILKWAQSSDSYIGKRGKQVWLSNSYVKHLTHQWRTEIDGILVGHNTALTDDPQLNVRYARGEDPIRIVVSRDVSMLTETKLFTDNSQTIFACPQQPITKKSNKQHISYSIDEDNLDDLLSQLWELGISRLMIEGGSKTLKKFIISKLWDEARVIRTQQSLGSGIRAPLLSGRKYRQLDLVDNVVDFIYRD